MKRACTLDYLCVRASCLREDRRGPLRYRNPQFPLQREKFRSQLCPQIISHGLLGCQRRPGGLPPQRRDSGSSSLLQRGVQADRRCSKRAWKINVGFTILFTTALRHPTHQTCCKHERRDSMWHTRHLRSSSLMVLSIGPWLASDCRLMTKVTRGWSVG